MLDGADFEFQTLQPEGSAAFEANFGAHGPGWGGVYRWSRQAAEEGGGSLSGSSALSQWDLLIIHLDADVADKTYSSARIQSPPHHDLPCVKSCPPPHETTDALRTVLLRWLGEQTCPPRIIPCTSSKTMDAWMLTAIFPGNATFQQRNWECHTDPERQINALPKKKRFSKKRPDYLERSEKISQAWPSVSATLTEATRFQEEFLRTID
ncbi:MAG: hypothetical protein F4X84_01690 [Synechococcus sp. SB0662_bin_45]|uniref:Uncharacterized protein n=1 Tax=Synechococcus sp. SB0676_bin_10 TaxID=2604869 RepID=A0A6B1F788_9SYNE|nr:hypothetical protein [Cyanobacteria bacterium MAG IRC3_bin_20]MDE0648349.1 hypothetical protein [Cyanobacteria bacterium MAG IRC4_bin_6]MXW11276.1 hypothetical protein [Synechococcus sp. SB0668_bin_13]MYE21110.1 hypothetical protein [Synechococcus sp. SB0662_bin_45]MYG37636.1 hypothetical protein [Synechococcus sp. SB0676_bin_10]MYG63904.1 hypothetical protein [Synechococcus sp. SB0675_bin_7]MYK06630.1 hypothetical protein [Synechococcus sp. SB0670_bin_20]MYK86106.1 hypothetical protein [